MEINRQTICFWVRGQRLDQCPIEWRGGTKEEHALRAAWSPGSRTPPRINQRILPWGCGKAIMQYSYARNLTLAWQRKVTAILSCMRSCDLA